MRRQDEELHAVLDVISIHAPVKGATRCPKILLPGSRYFNPRTREGCDFTPPKTLEVAADFNPRTREGCDPASKLPCSGRIHHFNPRTREGCDLVLELARFLPCRISIHAPVKGATHGTPPNERRTEDFNPRTREGCDGLQIGSVTICSLINHIAN